MKLDSSIFGRLVCPVHRSPVQPQAGVLVCESGDTYPIVENVPVMLVADAQQTIDSAGKTLQAARATPAARAFDGPPYFVETLGCSEEEKQEIRRELAAGHDGVDPVVRYLVAATNGILYKNAIGKLASYPIPELRLETHAGASFLDIGCGWGRWCVAAARKGLRPVGLDPSLGAVLAARRLCEQLGVVAEFVVGDARFLPFAPHSFDLVFSYSVVQHFSKADARQALAEIGRVLTEGGRCLVQMPNAYGIRSVQQQMRRGFREAKRFEVRYWSVPELKRAFSAAIGESAVSVDGYFGLGVQASDLGLLPSKYRRIVNASEALRRWSRRAPWMCYFADSVYVQSTARRGARPNQTAGQPCASA